MADDEAGIRRILETRLRMQGHEVIAAEDGERALELFRGFAPDLVVLDVMMPALDGFAVIERIRALLRRKEAKGEKDTSQDQVLARGPLILDQQRHQCTWNGQPVALTVTEFLILKALAVRPGHVKSRDQLMDAAYGESVYVDDRTIDSHIKRLRKKFKVVDDDFEMIETLYGVGYRFKE